MPYKDPEKRREADRLRGIRNRERNAELARAHYAAMTPEERKAYNSRDPEGKKARQAKYRDANRTLVNARSKDWKKANPGKLREYQHSRRARLRGVDTEVFSDEQMLELYGTKCYYCSEEIDLEADRRVGLYDWSHALHRAHVIASAVGGPNTLANCRPSHAICNLRNGTK